MRKEICLNFKAVTACMLLMLISGCGSANKEGGGPGQTATNKAIAIDSANPPRTFPTPPLASTLAGSIGGAAVAVNGTITCRNCHRQTQAGGSTLIDVYGIYTSSRHFSQTSGVGLADSSSTCKQCHDPFGDGAQLAAAGAIPVNKAVVGCEACHGGGGMHLGVGPLPAGKPGAARCGACHGTAWDSSADFAFHKTLFPEANGIYEDYVTSPHARSVETSTKVAGSTTDVTGTCGRCHTDEGAKVRPIVSGTLTQVPFTAALAGRSTVADASPVQCRTCHLAHDIGTTTAGRVSFIGELDTTAGTATWSTGFKTCTYCHQLYQADGTANTAFHNGIAPLVITDTHISVAGVPGYNIDATNPRACSNCHNPHKTDNTINNQFAASAHLDTTGSWVAEGNTTSANCQRCHTTTGFINYMGLVAANNNGGTTVTNTAQPLTTPGNEMLYCYGCHTNNKGGLRDPLVWQYTNGNATTYVIPPGRLTPAYVVSINAIGGSLLCAHCHMGRTTGQNVKNSTYILQSAAQSAAGGDHYYGTFGIMFRILGYEYDLAAGAYDNSPAHATIGTASSPAPGNGNGPCVGCHMYPDPGKAAANHEFKVFTRDAATGRVLSILPFGNTCSKCHLGGVAARIADVNTLESQYAAAVQAWRAVFASPANGVFYKLGSNPNTAIRGRWFTNFDGVTVYAGWPLTAADPGNKKVGAAYNLRTLDYRLNGKALFHNLLYTKRLMYDSIDFLDNGLLDQSVDATIAGLTVTTAYVNETASEYQITAADKALARAFFGPARP